MRSRRLTQRRRAFFLEVIRDVVDGDTVDPRVDLRTFFERIEFLVNLYKDFLCQIPGAFVVRRKPVRKVQDPLRIGRIDIVERLCAGVFLQSKTSLLLANSPTLGYAPADFLQDILVDLGFCVGEIKNVRLCRSGTARFPADQGRPKRSIL